MLSSKSKMQDFLTYMDKNKEKTEGERETKKKEKLKDIVKNLEKERKSYEHTQIIDKLTDEFGTQSLTSSGTYTEKFQSREGCDSTVVLTLNVNPVYNESIKATICEGSTYSFGTRVLTTSGEYVETFQSKLGCDSVVGLRLTVLGDEVLATEAHICEGEVYDFYGEDLRESGLYTKVFASSLGCDSVVGVNLYVGETLEVTPEAEELSAYVVDCPIRGMDSPIGVNQCGARVYGVPGYWP